MGNTEKPNKKRENVGCLVLSTIFWLGLMAFLLCGCKVTESSLTDKSFTDNKTEVKTVTIRDTVTIEVEKIIYRSDSAVREATDDTSIQFGAGGGTFNFATGEATNVNSLTISKREKELRKKLETSNETIKEMASRLETTADSLNRAIEQRDIDSKDKTKTGRGGWTWLWIGFAIGVIVGLVLMIFFKENTYYWSLI